MSKLNQAIEAIRSGDRARGRRILEELLKEDRRNEQAWLWLTQTTNDADERIRYLNNVLAINPENQHAKRGLEKLKPPVAQPPTPRVDKPPAPKKLKPLTTSPAKSITPVKSDRQLIEEAIARYTRQGYQVISQTESSAQLRKPKQWSQGLLVLGCVTLIVGFGLIVLIFAAIDYAMKKDRVIYLTAAELRAKTTPAVPPSSSLVRNLIIGTLALAFILCMAVGYFQASNTERRSPARTDLATVDPSPNTPAAEQPAPVLGALPGLQAADITVSLEERDFECEPAYQGEGYYRWSCLSETPLYRFDANIYGDTLTTVDYVSATALVFGGEGVYDVARSYLGFMATIPFDGGQPGEARAWVEANYRSASAYRSKFGPVPYTLTGPETGRVLTIGEFKW